jgi:hypothetical protein
MKRKEENRSVIEPSCTFSKPNKINCLSINRVLDRKPDRVTGYKVLIDLTSLIYIYYCSFHFIRIFGSMLNFCICQNMEYSSDYDIVRLLPYIPESWIYL